MIVVEYRVEVKCRKLEDSSFLYQVMCRPYNNVSNVTLILMYLL